MTKKTQRIGFIGAGWHTTQSYMPLLKESDDVEMAAVCDKSDDCLAKAKEDFGFAFATGDCHELLEQDLDAVVVSSPHFLHYEHAKAALEKGLHVLCEKPMTLRAREAHELAELARQKGRHLMLPCGWNFKPFSKKAKEWMTEGLVGEIEFVQCHFASAMRDVFSGQKLSATWQVKEQGGGYAYGQLSHPLALLFRLTPLRPRRLAALTRNREAQVDLYDAVTVEFETGVIGNFSGAATLPKGTPNHFSVRIFGRDGLLVYDAEAKRERLELLRRDGDNRSWTIPPGEGKYNVVEATHQFIDLLNGTAENDAPGEAGALSIDVIEALLHSAERNGEWVSIEEPSGNSENPTEKA